MWFYCSYILFICNLPSLRFLFTQAMINKTSTEKLKTQYEKLKSTFAFPRNVEVRG